MIKHQDLIDFSYKRNDTISMWVDHEYFKKFPISYTLEECLEDYCIEQQWDFHHIQFGSTLEECGGWGRFYYYHISEEPKAKQIHFSYVRSHSEFKVHLANGMSMILRKGDSVAGTLKELCMYRDWRYISMFVYQPDDLCGDGCLRYEE